MLRLTQPLIICVEYHQIMETIIVVDLDVETLGVCVNSCLYKEKQKCYERNLLSRCALNVCKAKGKIALYIYSNETHSS